ncbi:uncharacterized protein LOC126554001 [Aphis gossypii]|uniref:uncharacterized protein LOC126554001 n=1 Tax=Aphis gossypii TaxID=80765 RepID=UPI0021596000|nr:uncharacterized protein LOC126554001 [Aphis gossypii]
MVIEDEQVVEPNCVLLPVTDNILPEIEDDLNLNSVDISDLNLPVQENPTHLNVDDCFTTAINNIQFAGKVNGQPNLTTDNSKSKIGVLKESVNASMHMVETNDARNEILKNYYIAKLHLLKRRTEAKERIAAALEKKYLI